VTSLQSILLDHLVALLSAASWFATGTAAALRRPRLALGLLTGAALLTLIRVTTVVLLSGHGWWFVQEKVLLGLPLTLVTGLAAVLVAVPALLRARRAGLTHLAARAVLAPFAAGYAVLTGLAVTLLAGHPLAWGTALLAIGVVLGVTLVTARVVPGGTEDGAPGTAADHHPSLPTVTRRRLIAATGGAVLLTAGGGAGSLALARAPRITTGGGSGPALPAATTVTDLRGASTPAVGGIRRRHVLTAQQAGTRLSSGKEIRSWTFNGHVPGPALVAVEGDLLEVTLRNADIAGGVTLHWHGYDVACGEDGVPGVTQAAVPPGGEFVYRFRADQTGTYWFHTHYASHEGVRRGLYGTLVVHPRDPGTGADRSRMLDLTLPVHTLDGVVLIGDHDGPVEQATAPGTSVRLRVVNSDSDPHSLALAGSRFTVAAIDGRDLHEPDEVSEVRLRVPAGGRLDLTFEMPGTPVTMLVDDDPATVLRLQPPDAASQADTPDTGRWAELDLLHYGRPAPLPFDPERPDRHFTMVLDRGLALVDGIPAYAQTVNGLAHPSVPDQLVTEGDIVRFTVVNRSMETHPWHLHGHPVLVVAKDGSRPAGSPLWLDTFDVRPGEVWDVAFAATNPGVWMNHCHNLPHAEQGMMLHLAYDGFRRYDESHEGRAH